MANKRAFTLAELITAVFIASFIFLGTWSVYVMGWSWWHEINPQIESQRIARGTLSSITEGWSDPSAGTYTIGSTTYGRRNGMRFAMLDTQAEPPATPVISTDHRRLDFTLEGDNLNSRAFYMAADNERPGANAVYYQDKNGIISKINSSSGITELSFEWFIDGSGTTRYDMLKVTATVERTILGTRSVAYPIQVRHSDVVYLRNAR